MNAISNDLLRDKAYINGQWLGAEKSFDVVNPADGSVIGKVPDMGGKESTLAIEAAEKALPEWSKKTAKQRALILKTWADLMVENVNALAILLVMEQGKPLAEAKGEILYGASFLEWYAEEGKRAYGDIIPSPMPESRIVVTKQPIGVCAMITPWNFPSAMITRKVGPALAAGCTCICKPAEDTPLSALALAVLGEKAGVPAGVFNVVTGKEPVPITKEMCESNSVRKVSFTGSTAVGKILMRQCSKTLKKLSLELGGNAPFIVFDDANIDDAVEGAMNCKYRNSGQTCVSANRFFIQEGVYEEFSQKLSEKVKALQVGAGLEEKSTLGPLINQEAIEKVKEHVNDAVSLGGKIAAGGKPHSLGGMFFEPTVVTDVNCDMKLASEETFGPVAPLFKFKDEQDVIRLANATNYGLASYFYARDIGRIWRVAEALDFGMVAVNAGILSSEAAPFGGIKESGIGREGSKYGLDEYMEMKYILLSGIDK